MRYSGWNIRTGQDIAGVTSLLIHKAHQVVLDQIQTYFIGCEDKMGYGRNIYTHWSSQKKGEIQTYLCCCYNSNRNQPSLNLATIYQLALYDSLWNDQKGDQRRQIMASNLSNGREPALTGHVEKPIFLAVNQAISSEEVQSVTALFWSSRLKGQLPLLPKVHLLGNWRARRVFQHTPGKKLLPLG